MSSQELSSADLFQTCDPSKLGFETTNDLPDLSNVIGQPRALRALELGSEVPSLGYNIFVLGVPGSGRTTLTQEYLRRKAVKEPTPDDLCYVNNFENPLSPHALRLPPGRGAELRNMTNELVSYFKREIPKAFESEEYVKSRDQLFSEVKKLQEAEFINLQKYVEQHDFTIIRTTYGFVLAPALKGEPLKPEEIEKLTPEQRQKLEQLQKKLGEEVEKALLKLKETEREASQKLGELNRQTVLYLIKPPISEIKAKYEDLEQVVNYLDAVQKDILANVNQFIPSGPEAQKLLESLAANQDWTRRYTVNLLVDNSNTRGAPVILESQPSYQNLLGRIEHEFIMGASRTDFSMIRAGAFHRASGGYLILPARDVLVNTYAWEGLKRVLRDRCIRIIELSNQLGLLSSVTLEPEPIPLDTKVVLVGTPLLYYLLRSYDEDFAKLFKVRAEFATLMERTPETEHEYGLFVKSVVDDNQLPPFDKTAVARIIEYSARLAEDQTKLSTRFGKIADLVCEAAYWAEKNGRSMIKAESVQRAIDETIYRSNLLDERVQELIDKGTLMIDVEGIKVGQINALSVISLGDYDFGKPSRLTASVSSGKGGVVDIEREAKLGGPIHTKGVLIINGFLNGRYGNKRPLSLSASLTFEQSYEGVEGDSASAAELYALLSAIAEIPIRQNYAITGSVNQRGEIQAIGGVNEKIEGFFATCKAKGLTGDQGVIIPHSNCHNLMLNHEVIQAVAQGKFHIWPIRTIEEGITLLTGHDAGILQEDGSYPPGTFNHAVQTRLEQFSEAQKSNIENVEKEK
jgi:lon-related putative ATP-dependent protease